MLAHCVIGQAIAMRAVLTLRELSATLPRSGGDDPSLFEAQGPPEARLST
jgi:hypothetical protein